MFIGLINQRLKDISFEFFISDTHDIPEAMKNGNPLLGERFEIDWNCLLEKSVDIYIGWKEKKNINNLVLTLGDECRPLAVKVFSNEGKFLCEHRAETGCTIDQKCIVLPVEDEADGFVIKFDGEFTSIVIDNIEIYGADFEGENLFPQVYSYEQTEGMLCVDSIKSAGAADDRFISALDILLEKWLEKTDNSLSRIKDGDIRLIFENSIAPDGYILESAKNGITIKASNLRGAVYGCEVLIKLINEKNIPCCIINDEPYLPYRGVHLMMPAQNQFDFAKRLIKYVISPMGYNNIILELGGAMEYERHPKINEATEEACRKSSEGIWPKFPHGGNGGGKTIPKAVIKDFIDYSRSFGIDVIPEIQSLGHVQFMTIAYPEIAEIQQDIKADSQTDTRSADIPPSDFYAHSYCPSNPKSYEILFDIIDEVTELFAPCNYVHIGHDEVYQLGICPVCKNFDRGDLFAQDVNKIYNYLKDKNIKTMMWSDMIQSVSTCKHRAVGSIHKIPKDIICLDFIWYFNMDQDIEDNILKEGFKVAFGNLYSSHFPRYEKRAQKDGIIGGQISVWTATEEAVMAREGKIYDFIMTSQLLWSKSYTRLCHFSYDKLIRKMMPYLRGKLSNKNYPSGMPLAKISTIGQNPDFYPGIQSWQKIFDVNTKAKSLIFTHTATKKIMRYPWVKNDVIGNYIISYDDGSIEQLPVTYAGILTHFARRQGQPFTHQYYRHNGYTATYFSDAEETRLDDGSFMTMYRYEWINPLPGKTIIKIEYISNSKFDTDTFIQKIESVS